MNTNTNTNDERYTITMTDKARAYLEPFLKAKGETAVFRFGVKKSGCSGYTYIFDIAVSAHPHEICIKEKGISVLLDPQDAPILKGTAIDLLEKELGQKQLQFHNPNIINTCGCGESFTVLDE